MRGSDFSPIVCVLALAAVTPLALGCWRCLPGGAADDVEDGPCTGACMAYQSCPTSDSCASGYLSGVAWCTIFGWPDNCVIYAGGFLAPNGCCYGGVVWGTGSPIMVNRCTVSGQACWGVPLPP